MDLLVRKLWMLLAFIQIDSLRGLLTFRTSSLPFTVTNLSADSQDACPELSELDVLPRDQDLWIYDMKKVEHLENRSKS